MALVFFFLTVRLSGQHTNSQVWREHSKVKGQRVKPMYISCLPTLPLTLAAQEIWVTEGA